MEPVAADREYDDDVKSLLFPNSVRLGDDPMPGFAVPPPPDGPRFLMNNIIANSAAKAKPPPTQPIAIPTIGVSSLLLVLEDGATTGDATTGSLGVIPTGCTVVPLGETDGFFDITIGDADGMLVIGDNVGVTGNAAVGDDGTRLDVKQPSGFS